MSPKKIFNNKCIENCPDNMFIDGNKCVDKCTIFELEDRTC